MRRNSNRARRRYLGACGQLEARNGDSLEAGNVPPGPAGDGAVPVEPKDIRVNLPPRLNLFLGSQDPRLAVQMILYPTGGTPSKRPGRPLDTFLNKERRASRDLDEASVDISLADFGIPRWGR